MSTTTQMVKPEEAKYGIMDVLDEDLIREELSGLSVDELVYEFMLGGKKVTGLTVYGVLAMARLAVDSMPNIEISCDQPITVEREKSWKSSCRTTYTNKATGSSVSFWGTKVQQKDITNKEGVVVKENDPNAEQICEMKAMRNSFLKIFPPKESAEFLNMFRSEGKIKELSPQEVEEAAKKAEMRGRKNVSAEVPRNELDPDEIPEIQACIDTLRWVAPKQSGGGTELWTPEHSEGWVKVQNAEGGIIENARALIAGIANHAGSFTLNGEVFSEDLPKGRVTRKKI